MNILIIGGSGAIGQSLYQNFKNENHNVAILTRSPKNDNEFFWDLDKEQIDIKALEFADVIIHLAGASVGKRWTSSYKKEILESRVKSTNLLFSKCKEHGIELKHFVGASGIGFYGETGENIVDESNSVIRQDFLSDVCVEWEKSEKQFESICPVSIVRIGFVLGQGFDGFNKIIQPIKAFVGAPLGSGNQYMSWIHISDLTNIFSFVINNNVAGVVNGCSPEAITNKDLTKKIAKSVNRPLILPNVPRFVLKILLGEMADLALTGTRAIPKTLMDNNFQFEYKDIDSALESLLGK